MATLLTQQGVNFPDGSLQTTAAAGATPSVPAGAVMPFYNTTAPVGWTQVTTVNDYAIRIVSSAGGTTGGTTAFSSVFTNQTPTGSVSIAGLTGSIGSTVLTTAQMPSHSHSATGSDSGHQHAIGSLNHTHSFSGSGTTGNESNSHTHNVQGNTGGQSDNHTHGFSGGGTTAGQNADHTHAYGPTNTDVDAPAHVHGGVLKVGGGPYAFGSGGGSMGYGDSTGDTPAHIHTYSGATNGTSNSHAHDFSVGGTTDGASATHLHAFNVDSGGISQNHNHSFSVGGTTDAALGGVSTDTGQAQITVSVGSTGGADGHTHSLSVTDGTGTFTGNPMNFNVNYVNMLLCTKN